MPGGNPVGEEGTRPDIRELPGGQSGAESMFNELSKGGTPNTPPNYPGTGTNVPGGGWVGLRPESKSGPPTIDVNIPGVPIDKINLK
jgi:hypothetical protein